MDFSVQKLNVRTFANFHFFKISKNINQFGRFELNYIISLHKCTSNEIDRKK